MGTPVRFVATSGKVLRPGDVAWVHLPELGRYHNDQPDGKGTPLVPCDCGATLGLMIMASEYSSRQCVVFGPRHHSWTMRNGKLTVRASILMDGGSRPWHGYITDGVMHEI